MKSLIAKLHFLWCFILHFLWKIFRRKKDGAQEFLDHYREDRLAPLSKVDKDWLFQFSKCLNCSLCDQACPALLTLPRDKFPGPSYLLTTYTRATPDFWAVDLDFSLCRSCEDCQKICPNQVPVKEALEFIEAKSQETFRHTV